MHLQNPRVTRRIHSTVAPLALRNAMPIANGHKESRHVQCVFAPHAVLTLHQSFLAVKHCFIDRFVAFRPVNITINRPASAMAIRRLLLVLIVALCGALASASRVMIRGETEGA